jgi:hypothetical protein
MGILMLALVWVWKSNQVKDYYAKMRRLEIEKKDIISENMRLRGSLMDLKSLSQISKVVTQEYGLTQNVSERIFVMDPVTPEKKQSKLAFAGDMKDVPDWLDNAISGSGRVRAESEKDTQ